MDSHRNGASEGPAVAVDEPEGLDLDRLWAIAKWFILASAFFLVFFFFFHLFYENRCKKKRKGSCSEDERVPFEIKYRYKSQGGKEGMNLMIDPHRYAPERNATSAALSKSRYGSGVGITQPTPHLHNRVH